MAYFKEVLKSFNFYLDFYLEYCYRLVFSAIREFILIQCLIYSAIIYCCLKIAESAHSVSICKKVGGIMKSLRLALWAVHPLERFLVENSPV